jgi:enamine deaminase RidA (YjgF/YER057c/UK114 family)
VVAGPHIFVSGQLPADASGNLVEGSIADKTTAVCENIKNILEDAGSSISRVVKVRWPFLHRHQASLVAV